MTDSLDGAALGAALVAPESPWATIEHHASIGSTNARAAEIGAPWVVVVADHQSAGRGRLRRTWEAPPGSSVAVSVTVPLPSSGAGWLPLLAGLAVAEALETAAGVRADLKWPNDVLLPGDGDRKVCGVLCEVVPQQPIVVVGAGINVSQTREQLPVPTATSLALAGAADVDRTAVVAEYLRRLAGLVAARGELPRSSIPESSRSSPLGEVRERYRSRCVTLGRRISLSLAGRPDVVGEAVAVDDEGRLVVDAGGERRAWAAGDVVHLRPAAGAPSA